ncbi:RDD family protein [Mycolicibacterium hodleri]|uniref:RDD family protein n=1 Tax=Mycolicibacterium hodleri TaxID=49897 RepID=A0A502DZG1_9MYCO|nr:RDD family protein [Mycolicibacterium hodleri]TPG29666.1 RDD family protein [Mycolicibacterium hodleri]
MNTAGIVSRSVAAVIDLIVVGAIVGIIYLGVALTRLMLQPSAFSFPELNAIFSTTVLFGVAVLYLTGCWVTSGCTAGAVVMGVRVVDTRSARLSLPVAVLRAVACVVFPVGVVLVAVDKQRRSVQDVVLRTRVVYVRPDA